jgi:putative PIN family toxin of toxin-antitoxin system
VSGYQIVIDTNVLVAALRSRRGAAYRLLMLIGQSKFEVNVSVPLFLEYEDVTKRLMGSIPLAESDLEDILDYVCSIARQREIYYLWRPFLKDGKDDMILEVAVTAGCDYIVTYNRKDFAGVEQFGVRVIIPREFLQAIGEWP